MRTAHRDPKHVLLAATLALGFQAAAADAMGTAFTYQGRLADEGLPASGTYDMQFALYYLTATGMPLARVDVPDVPVSNGYFTTKVDFGDAGLFDGTALALEIGVSPDTNSVPYATLVPRQELTPTPYALYALESGGGGTVEAPLTLTCTSMEPAIGGNNNGAGTGVHGSSALGYGVHGVGSVSGVHGQNSGSGDGVSGSSQTGSGVYGVNAGSGNYGILGGNAYGVHGRNNGSGDGVSGSSQTGNGVYGENVQSANYGILGGNSNAVYGNSSAGDAVLGESDSANSGVRGQNAGAGPGMSAYSRLGWGLKAEGFLCGAQGYSASGSGLMGISSNGYGITAWSGGGVGIKSVSEEHNGIYSVSWAGGMSGVLGHNTNSGVGVTGSSQTGNGVYGVNVETGNHGMLGGNWYAVYGSSTSHWAGHFDGKVMVDGHMHAKVVKILGGSDVSEGFHVGSESGAAQPGMVVSIDPVHAGQLRVSRKAYDRTVAGVLSGAGGVNPGLVLGQENSAACGDHPVALSGRVYCWADTSSGAIQPGDLLTTSDTPGHAMRVGDYAAAQGAILGKAMSGLEAGRGLVLVLVTLQ